MENTNEEPPSASSAASPAVVVAPHMMLDIKEETEEIFVPDLLKRQNQERKWAVLPDGILSQIGERLLAEDVAHYISFQEHLHSCTFGGDLLRFELEEQLQDQVELKIKTIMPGQGFESGLHLVESDGDLLMLRRLWRNKHRYFEVFKVVVRSDGVGHEKVTLKPINNLGDRALFIHDRWRSVAVSTHLISPCIKPNAVYFYWRSKKAKFTRNVLSVLPFIPTASRNTDTGCS